MGRHALNQGSWGSAECCAALVALETIAHELDLTLEAGWVANGGTAWTRLVGEPLPTIVDS
jgi:hypothetical protein